MTEIYNVLVSATQKEADHEPGLKTAKGWQRY